jgi:tetratricopeptide (TPR) repeat protein
LARVHDHLGNREQAIAEFQESLAILRATGDEARPEALATMMSLATTFGAQERSDEAQAIQEQALALSKAHYGEDHPETARIRIAIATRRNGGKRSLELLREELVLNQATLGVRHPRTLDTQRHLADELHLHGHIEQAERAYLESLGTARGIYGDNHPSVIRLVLNLNWLYQHTQQSTKTGPLLREFEPAARATFGPQSIRYAEYLTVLGTAMLHDERNDAGAGVLNQSLNTLIALGQDQGWQGAEPRMQLAMHAESNGAYDEVERLSREILAIEENGNGDRMAARRAVAKSLLGNVLTRRREFAAAETLLLEGYEGLAGRESLLPFQRRAIERLISLYETWDAAEPDAGHARHAEQWHDMLKDNT